MYWCINVNSHNKFTSPKVPKISLLNYYQEMFFFFGVGKKIFIKKEQIHKFLNKSSRSNEEVA